VSKKAIQYGRTRLNPDRIATVIRDRRAAHGMSLRELADKSGVASSTIHNLEQGSYKLQLDKFLAILGALDLAPQEVLEIDQRIDTPPLTEQEALVAKLLREGNHAELLRLLAKQLEGEDQDR
jgi:transcriptional regulator with XRE-family HTH domain